MSAVMDTVEPVIDHEFRDYLSALRPDEYRTLESSILANGCETPLTLWGNVIVDGHNRHRICTEHGVPFETEQRVFADRAAVIDWMLVNQLGRRNLSPDDFRLFIGRLYNSRKNTKAEAGAMKSNPQNEGSSSTAETIASEHGTSRATVERSGKQAEAIDTKASPELKEAVRNHDVPVSAAAVIAELPEQDQAQIVAGGADAAKQAAKQVREGKPVHVSQNSGNDEWYTPPEFIESARAAMGSIDTDPASCEVGQRNVKAGTHYTQDDDGLAQEWRGNVWLNPPYSKELIGKFIEATCEKSLSGEFEQACVLVNNATETGWGQSLLQIASAVCFVSKRIRYLDHTGTPQKTGLQGQMVCYIGQHAEEFEAQFDKHGVVLHG